MRCPPSLYLGYNAGGSGTYNLSGSGLLSARTSTSATSGSGSFTQSGGTNSVGPTLYLGYNAGSSGTYNLSGSGLLSAPDGVHRLLRHRQLHAVGRNQFGAYVDLYLGHNAAAAERIT